MTKGINSEDNSLDFISLDEKDKREIISKGGRPKPKLPSDKRKRTGSRHSK